MLWKDRWKPVVLLVEDDPGDQELTRRALGERGGEIDLRVVSDGEEALEYLKHVPGDDEESDCPPPDLILLDLNMPKFDGREILKYVRRQPDLKLIPVVVLTTSRNERDVRECYELGCNTFVSKPDSVEEFMDSIGLIGMYWLRIASTAGLCPT